jgi:hypothetical protein
MWRQWLREHVYTYVLHEVYAVLRELYGAARAADHMQKSM